MPQRPQRPCRHKGCRNLHRNANGYCDQHQAEASKSRWGKSKWGEKSAAERGYDHEWRKLRASIMERDKWLCQPCMRHGVLTEATEVDHIISKADGGSDDPENLQAICKVCHRIKTAFDSAASRKGAKNVRLYPEWLEPAQCDLTIVFGPPGSGKSTYVAKRASGTDLVIDLDELISRLSGRPLYQADTEWLAPAIYCRNEMLGLLSKQGRVRKAWFITTGQTPDKRLWWASRLQPSECVTLFPGQDECIRRIKADARRIGKAAAHIRAVMDWVPDDTD